MSAADENWQALALHIEAALPQTQCTRCGYPDCAGYARAIAQGQAAINQCPPGGAEGVLRLAAVTGQPPLSLNPEHGSESPRSIAVIDEAWCIGCTLCLAPCPTDAILGANKQLHTVMQDHCTGCGLCVPVCPVDCIQLHPVSGAATGWQAWSAAQAQQALARYRQHRQRLEGGAALAPEAASVHKTAMSPLPNPPLDKKAAIAAALAKARARRTG